MNGSPVRLILTIIVHNSYNAIFTGIGLYNLGQEPSSLEQLNIFKEDDVSDQNGFPSVGHHPSLRC